MCQLGYRELEFLVHTHKKKKKKKLNTFSIIEIDFT